MSNFLKLAKICFFICKIDNKIPLVGLVRPNWKNGLKFLQYSMEHKVIIMISISYSFSRKTFCDLIFEKPINTTALVRGATWHGIIIACLLRPNYWVQTPNLHLL